MNDDTLVVRLDPSRLWQRHSAPSFVILAAVIGLALTVGGLSALDRPAGPEAATAGALVAVLSVAVFVRMTREHLVFGPEAITQVGWRETRALPLDEVCSVALWQIPSEYRLNMVVVLPRRGRRIVAAVSSNNWMKIQRWVRRMEPDIVVDPPAIWQDRFGDMHGLPPDSDPAASLRAVREAYVDVWHVKIEVSEVDGRLRFRTIANTVWGPPGLWAGDERDTLAEATADGVAMIEDLRHTT